MQRMKKYLFAIVTIVAATASAQPATAAVEYTIHDLGPSSYAYATNEDGVTVGYLSGSPYTAFRWRDGVLTQLSKDVAQDINDEGWIAGYDSAGIGGQSSGWVSQPGVGYRSMGTFGGRDSRANAVSNAGWVVGWADAANGANHAFLWKNGVKQDLGTSLYYDESEANDINDVGQVIGTLRRSTGATRAFLWQDGTMEFLGGDLAYAINDNGDVVGQRNGIAWLLSQVDGTINLGTLGGSESYALGINNAGQVVGSSYTQLDLSSNAFLYDPVDGLRNLNSVLPAGSGWVLTTAYDINESGQIVGYGRKDGGIHGFVLTPIPEPSGALLVIAGFWCLRRRRRHI